MADDRLFLGLFTDEARTASAIEDLKVSPFELRRVHGPFPSHKIAHALNQKKSRVGYFTLAGGIFGFFTGYALATFTSVQWNLIVSGKPIFAPIPFLIVGFEFTILFAVFGNVIGMLTQTRLPKDKVPDVYDPKCTGTHFGIVAACAKERVEELRAFFQTRGGDVRVFEQTESM